VAIRPREDVLTMETLLFGDEVVSPSDLGELPDPDDVKASKKEVDMARQLIESLSTEFDPSKYHDEYREAVLEMIERKAQGEEITIQAPEEAPAEVPDLMAALEASIASAKRQGGSKKAATRKSGPKAVPKAASKSDSKAGAKSGAKKKTASGNGSKPGSNGRKRPAAKK